MVEFFGAFCGAMAGVSFACWCCMKLIKIFADDIQKKLVIRFSEVHVIGNED